MKLTTDEQQEATEARTATATTKRPTIPALEELLYDPMPVLDHGSVTLVDYQGDEDFIVAAARVSYGRGTTKKSNNRGLLRHLMRHQHWTPYEQCSLVFRIEMPIVVMRQLVRHRTAKLNEYSGRYSVMPGEFYVPDTDRLAVQSTTNKQGSGSVLSDEDAQAVLDLLRKDAEATFGNYNKLLDDFNLARELARINLPLSAYTKVYWKMDLRNLLHFLSLRMDSHAQWEIRQFADAMGEVVAAGYPEAWAAFNDYHPMRDALLLTAPEQMFFRVLMRVVGHATNTAAPEDEDVEEALKVWDDIAKRCGLSAREVGEFRLKLPALGMEHRLHPNVIGAVPESILSEILLQMT